MQNNFFKEFLQRIISKNPKFFRWIQLAAIVLGAASAVFSFLSEEHVTLPGWANVISNGIVKILACLTIILAQLPNVDPAAKK